jgi:RNA polymerase sigma factor (sigma-70 family)
MKNKTSRDQAEENFWEIWQQERDTLYYYCLNWMNGNSTDAEDALSCAMIKAWEKFQDSTYLITNLRAWLTRLTRNFCIDIHRKRQRKTLNLESIEAITEKQGDKILSKEISPDQVASQQELDLFLRKCIDNLPIKLKQVFILYTNQNLSYLEIAQELDISYDTVRKRISHARKILQSKLAQYDPDYTFPQNQPIATEANIKNPAELNSVTEKQVKPNLPSPDKLPFTSGLLRKQSVFFPLWKLATQFDHSKGKLNLDHSLFLRSVTQGRSPPDLANLNSKM